MRKTARDGRSDEQGIARLCLRMMTTDHNENHSPENGQFISNGGGGTGGNSEEGGSTSSEPKLQPNIKTLKPKQQKRAHEISNAISSDAAKLREKGMRAHVPGTAEYRRHAKEMEFEGKKASTFEGDYHEFIPEVKAALKNRTAFYKVLKTGDVHAKIDLGRTTGTTHGKDGKSAHKTTIVTVVYSAKWNDWHFYPDDPD